jgi:predicted nucleotidyltransferase
MTDSKEMCSSNEIKEKLIPLFKDEDLQLVLLFGSAASGKTYKRSDIDLAFLYKGPVDVLDLTTRVIRLLHADNIDVVDLRHTNSLLQFSVVKHGKLLYERSPGLFNSFYSLSFRRYIDTKKLRDAQGETIKHFLEEKE